MKLELGELCALRDVEVDLALDGVAGVDLLPQDLRALVVDRGLAVCGELPVLAVEGELVVREHGLRLVPDVLDLELHSAELALGLGAHVLIADLRDPALDAVDGELELAVADRLADLRGGGLRLRRGLGSRGLGRGARSGLVGHRRCGVVAAAGRLHDDDDEDDGQRDRPPPLVDRLLGLGHRRRLDRCGLDVRVHWGVPSSGTAGVVSRTARHAEGPPCDPSGVGPRPSDDRVPGLRLVCVTKG